MVTTIIGSTAAVALAFSIYIWMKLTDLTSKVMDINAKLTTTVKHFDSKKSNGAGKKKYYKRNKYSNKKKKTA